MTTEGKAGADSGPRASVKGSPRSGSQPDTGPSPAGGIDTLLLLEERARSFESVQELQFFIANDTRKLVGYRQAIVFSKTSSAKFSVQAISSLTLVDRTSPFVGGLEALLGNLQAQRSIDSIQTFSMNDIGGDSAATAGDYPFDAALWVPFADAQGSVFAGMLLVKEATWADQQVVIAQRLAGAYAHAWSALRATARIPWIKRVPRKTWFAVVSVIAVIAMCIPVPLATLAPVEVVAAAPYISAAPLQGVIEEVLVEPNSEVHAGDILFRYEDTDFRNQYNIAQQSVQVAAARLRQAKQVAFVSSEQNHEIRILEAEYNRSQLEYDYARQQFEQVDVRAPQAGVVIYSSREDWTGRPVAVGERIMRIADPAKVEFGIDVAVNDAIALKAGSRVRVYLDSDPLSPIEATIMSASYQAAELPGKSLAYRIRAAVVSEDSDQVLRIGQRGAAKVFGETVPLFFYLFRRPIAAVRQELGL